MKNKTQKEMNENETKKLDQDKLLFIYFHLVWYPFSFLSYSKPLFAYRSIPLVFSTYPYNRMWGGQASTYGVKFKARCLVAYNDEAGEEKTAERHLFMLGTTALREENEIHVLEYVEDTGNVECRQVFNHPSELWDVQPCPSDNRTLFTAYNTGSTMKGTLWGLPDPAEYLEEKDGGGGGGGRKSLEELVTLRDSSQAPIGAGVWDAEGCTEASKCLLTWSGPATASEEVFVWDVRGSAASVKSKFDVAGRDARRGEGGGSGQCIVYTAAWDPHRPSSTILAIDSDIVGWDVRDGSEKTAFSIPNAHGLSARDVDFNPNKPYCFLSCGDDGKIKFWDFRKTASPMKVLSGHSHWVTRAKFNPFHDQLVLSGSSDSTVGLWRAASISSAPLLELEGEDSDGKDVADGVIRRFDEHEDSVYGLAWSICDAWVFASLSYDGRFVVNHVPSAEKYKILL